MRANRREIVTYSVKSQIFVRTNHQNSDRHQTTVVIVLVLDLVIFRGTFASVYK